MKQANLVLHCGARKVERNQVELVPTPERTKTWTPLSHIDLVRQIESVLDMNNLKVVNQVHALTHDGLRYFGLMQIQNGQEQDDYTWILGLRNSHDKSFPAGLLVGAQVFICDNLSFSSEIKMLRKHTVHIKRDLPMLTERAIGKLHDKWHSQDKRIEAYKGRDIADKEAHDLVIRAVDVRACTPSRIPMVLRHWRQPQYEDFTPRTLWSLFNSFTQVLKDNFTELPKRTEALHGLMDSYSGLN